MTTGEWITIAVAVVGVVGGIVVYILAEIKSLRDSRHRQAGEIQRLVGWQEGIGAPQIVRNLDRIAAASERLAAAVEKKRP